jgi:hypothetical protein
VRVPASAPRAIWKATSRNCPRSRDEELRERSRLLRGEETVVELSPALASARVFPTVKRGMGYATR